jgi:putative glutamine amidotransferase
VDPARDELELTGIKKMQAAGKRMLGVCRGAQVLAVAAGGTLVQDLPAAGFPGHRESRSNRTYGGATHSLKVERATLADLVLNGLEVVNSEHHQAIDAPGDSLVATARSLDGSIEAVEGDRTLGIQWHPELLIDEDDRHLRPFQWLVHGREGLST